MIAIQCQCGSTLTLEENDHERDRLCPDCGQRLRIACAETLPAGAGDADFDAVLVQQAGSAAAAPSAGRIALGGVADISIGRLAGSAIELPGHKVSRQHARLIRVDFGPSRWKVADTGSSAGLFINGQRIQEQELQPGDTVSIGEYQFQYALASASSPEAELPAFLPPSSPLLQSPELPARAGFWTTPKIIIASVGGALVLLVALGLAILVPSLLAARATGQGLLCGIQLKQIGLACMQYEQQFGSYPATLGDLAAVRGVSTAIFICPTSDAPAQPAPTDRRQLAAWINQNASYTYPGPKRPGLILAYEKAGAHKPDQANVLQADGAVDQLTEADLQRQLSAKPAAPVTVTLRPTHGAAAAHPAATPSQAAPTPPRPAPVPALALAPAPAQNLISLTAARQGFKTTLTRHVATSDPVDQPPARIFRTVQYDAPPGKLAAYLTPDPGDGAKHPAIIWITGGDCNSIGDVWTASPPANDQTAAAYRKAGIIMMFPSLRGGNGNPGNKEGFYGEVDDVLAAADFLAAQPYVDPARIYLGGHSTGGTMALLVAEYSPRFRAVICFGPVEDVTGYGDDTVDLPFNKRNPREIRLRAPGQWLGGIQTPTFIFEGGQSPGNKDSLYTLASASTSPKAQFFLVSGKTHFSILAPTNQLVADKITRDTGPQTNLAFSPNELPGLTPIRTPAPAATAPTK